VYVEGPGAEEIDDQEDVSAATHWLLPAAEMEGLWENYTDSIAIILIV